MRLLPIAAFLSLCSSVIADDPAAQSAFPYTAHVDRSADVRSGPGQEYYTCHRLAPGKTVEVYRRDAGGWLAIRPPAASFSLVAARHVEETDVADVVRVTSPHAVSWVGLEEPGQVDHKWQVRLRVGEQLKVLGEVTQRTYAAGTHERYYRVSPPAGEFRWVHEAEVRHPSQAAVETSREAAQLADFRVLTTPPNGPARRDGFVARGPELAAADAPLARVASRAPLPAQEIDQLTRQLDVELSLAISHQSPAKWDLDELQTMAQRLLDSAQTSLQRGRIKLLQDQLATCQRLQTRYATAFRGASSETDPAGSPANALGAVTTAAPPTSPDSNEAIGTGVSSSFNPRFDGVGWLLPVHSAKPGAPPYALLDGAGQIRQFVSPAPGLNLHRYLRKEIGVFGQRRAHADLNHPHLTAMRVVDLKRHRR